VYCLAEENGIGKMIGKTISHYKILEKLGGGGMGVVYTAEDTKLHRIVALKFLPPELTRDEETKHRFIQEAQSASSLDHNNICAIHEVDETDDGQIFICMNYYDGETLKNKIGRCPIRLDEAIDIAIQIANGLQKAHEKGIVHRDIKPANIFITNDGVVKILDFGLAKLSGQTMMTKIGSTVGTVAYMSPEQTRGELVDNRTDIWSLGVVLFEMITGKLPFKGEYEQATLYSILNEEPEPPTGLRTGVPMELERVINKTLSKVAEKRYQHIDEMTVDLRRLQQNKSGSITSPAKKLKLLLKISAAVILLAVVGIYFLYFKSDSTTVNRKSIAVLPFENLSDSKEDEYFSDGITDDIIAQLSKIADLKVISRTSIMQYKGTNKNVREIGEELDVATVLEGSVRRIGNQIRIVAQLIDAKNEGHLWAETYDKEMTQVFAIQSDVAQRIAIELKAKLSPLEKERIEKKQTENTEAYQLYLKGRFYWNKRRLDDMMIALNYFKQAIEIDPDYALAYAGLASAYVLIPQYGSSQEDWYTNAQNAAMKALRIDSTLAEAHTVLGEIAQDHHYDWEGAEKHFRLAIELDPGYPTAHQWYSCTLYFLNRFDEALSEANRALELDPLSIVINMNLGDVYYAMRQYDKSMEQYKNTLALDHSFPWAHSGMANIYEVQGRFEEAISEYNKAKSLGDSVPYTIAPFGWIYAKLGRKADALRVLNEFLQLVQHRVPISYGIALTYYELGEKDKAFEWFEKSYEDRENWLVVLGYDPLWDDLRTDPRCIALLKKMGLRK
jgi:serine/threonine protein kinase/Tfp pilus assembly protein PilF